MNKFFRLHTILLFLLLGMGLYANANNVSICKMYYKEYVGIGNSNEQFDKIKLETKESDVAFKYAKLKVTDTDNIKDIDCIKIFSTGCDSVFSIEKAQLLGEVKKIKCKKDILCKLSGTLSKGDNYIWVICDISEKCNEWNKIEVTFKNIATNKGIFNIAECNKGRVAIKAFNTVFDINQDGSRYYRIPALTTAANGSLIAVTDKRGDIMTDLPNTISIVARRSVDNGKTWSDAVYIAKGDKEKGKTYGDAAVVLDKKSGNLIAVFVGDKGLWDSTAEDCQQLYTSTSCDNGLTWSEPRNITSQIFSPEWQGGFAGSGNALQLNDGRLMFVIAVRATPENYGPLSNYAVYSDNGGESWKVSENSPTSSLHNRGDEAKVVELNNGDILMSIRNPDKGYRKFSISKDRGESWSEAEISTSLIEPACNGDIIRYNFGKKNFLLHTLPASKTDRKDVSLYISTDEGKNWQLIKTITNGMSAYSSMTMLNDGTIGVLVEVGKHITPTDEVGMRLIYYNFSIDELIK